VQVTVVVPKAKLEPEGGMQTIVKGGSTPVSLPFSPSSIG
jgi:hypothetical protein